MLIAILALAHKSIVKSDDGLVMALRWEEKILTLLYSCNRESVFLKVLYYDCLSDKLGEYACIWQAFKSYMDTCFEKQ